MLKALVLITVKDYFAKKVLLAATISPTIILPLPVRNFLLIF